MAIQLSCIYVYLDSMPQSLIEVVDLASNEYNLIKDVTVLDSRDPIDRLLINHELKHSGCDGVIGIVRDVNFEYCPIYYFEIPPSMNKAILNSFKRTVVV